MTHQTINERPVHWAAEMHAQEYRKGEIDRREFLARATSFGVTAAAAYSMIGLQSPVQAAAHARPGGTLRVQMSVRALKDPRTYDWSELGNETLIQMIDLLLRISIG